MTEIWKDIDGWQGIYQISSWGRVRKMAWMRRQKNGVTKRIVPVKNSKGWYLSIVLRYRKRCQSEKVHRLVAKAFLPNPHNLREVNHIDCNKQNNHVENLEWVDRKTNHAHAVANVPTMLRGLKRYNTITRPKRIIQCTLNGKIIGEYLNAMQAHRATGVCARNILQVASCAEYKPGMTRRQAGGYIWKFKEESGVKDDAVHQLFLKFSG